MPSVQRATLATGDYSLEGLADVIAVERKSLADLAMCVGRERERFERELERLARMPYPALVVEASMADILLGAARSEVHPHAVIGSLVSWSVRFRIPVWLCTGRREAAAITYKILLKALEAHTRQLPENE